MTLTVGLYELRTTRVGTVCEVPPSCICPADATPILRQLLQGRDREVFAIVALDARSRVIGSHIVSIGTLSASLVHPREVFRWAILTGAHSIICGHNHPSGDVTPSHDDLDLTHRLVKAGELLGIEVIDHIVIGDSDHLSCREKGLL